MAPRGIVAAATASTFGAQLVAHHVGGAAKILPVTFLVIVLTVSLYGLSAVPVARRLGVTRPARTRPLLVGGDPWVVDLARALRTAGLDVLMWAASEEERRQIQQAGLRLAAADLLASVIEQGAELEDVNAVLLLTNEDDFNALAATTLADNPEITVYRLAPDPARGVVAPYTAGETLFAPSLTRPTVSARYTAGARITTASADGTIPPGTDLLFGINGEGTLHPATSTRPPNPQRGDTLVLLAPSGTGTSPEPAAGS